MHRKIAIALVAASVLAAPALAAAATPATAPQATTGSASGSSTVKTAKADQTVLKHRKHAAHHRGTKMVKHIKPVKFAHHLKGGKVTHVGKTVVAKRAAAKTGDAAPAAAQVSAKPAVKSGVN